jgi:putative DNA primase/helicase
MNPLDRIFHPPDPHLAEKELKKAFAKADRERAARNGNGHSIALGAPTATELASISELTTDVGNAARLVRRHGEEMRYSHERGQWLLWPGKQWLWDKTGRPCALAKETALSIFDEARDARDDSKRQALSRWAVASQKRERISAMLSLAQPDLAITIDQLDADKDSLNFENGTVDLRTGELRPHQRKDYITKICPVVYSPDAPRGAFDRFLSRIFRGNPALVDWAQVMFGYAATAWTREQCMFFCYGAGGNGKTSLLDAVAFGLGNYAVKADPDLLMARDGSAAHPCSIADLMGVRLAVCSETNDGRRFDESRLKDLVGESILKARFMRENFFQFVATHKIFAYSNHKPVVHGTDRGFWRRMKVVPFVENIATAERDMRLAEKLKAEAAGIMAWVVEGAIRWHKDGLGTCPEIDAATSEYQVEMDSIGAFLAENYDEAETLQVYAAEIYDQYRKWAEKNGEHALSQKRLGGSLKERGFISERCSYSGRKKWLGIGLRAQLSANDAANGSEF